MTAGTACPIYEVDTALSSYVNSREETLRIRRTLSKYLTASLRPVNLATQGQHLNHECPQSISAVSTNPPGMKSSYLEYLQALRACHQAQARHRELQASFEDLQQRHVDENPVQTQSVYDDGTTQGYVSLLRQRRCQSELQVIQDSLEKLLVTITSQGPQDPRTLVNETLGEQPDLPAERLDQLSQGQDDQTWIFKLKQEVLDARLSLDRADAARKEAQAAPRELPTLQQQVCALECARDEIVEWVQGELAKMEEDSVFLEDASPIKRPVSKTSPVNLASVEERIRGAYDQYTIARASLIQHYENLQHLTIAHVDGQEESTSNSKSPGSRRNPQPQMPITNLLPHFSHFAGLANIERALLQQSVYLQNQIVSADQDIAEALLRLSGESHLLPAGSKDVAAWGKTAMEAEAATAEFVKEHLNASRQEVSNVNAIVELCSLQSKVLAST